MIAATAERPHFDPQPQEGIAVVEPGALGGDPQSFHRLRQIACRIGLTIAMSVGISGMSALTGKGYDLQQNVAEATENPETQGSYQFNNSQVVDEAMEELGQTFETGWDKPGECMVAAHRWVIAANGGQNFFNYTGGVISVWTASGGKEVSLNALRPGDVLQKSSVGNDWDSNWDFVHTMIFRGYNADGTVKVIEANGDPKNSPGKVTANDKHSMGAQAGWHWRAFRFGKVDGSSGGGTISTNPGAAAERSVVKTSDNNYYLKHGGVFWHLGSGLSADAISQWGTYAGSVDTGQLHDREVNYTRDGYSPGAHPPVDGTVVQQPNSTQLYTFIGGEAFPLGSMAEVDALGLRNRIGTIPGGKLVPEFFEVPNLPDGFLFKKFGGAAVRMATGNISQWVSSESALACVELRVGGTNLVPASFEDRLAANGRISPETVGCEFPANWTLNVPGSSQRWRITGDGKGRPYVRYDYPNMLAIACGTNGQPAYQQLRSTAALTSITSGGTLHCPENTFLRDSDYGHIYQYKGGALHKVPSMNTLSCLNNPNLISTKQEYLGGIAVGSDVACSLEGRVIKEPTGQIWYIKDGQRHYAQNMAIVNGLLGRVFSTGGQLTSTSAQEANSYVIGANAYVPYGPPIFAKYAGDARVWLVLRDGTKRHALSLCNGASPMTLPDGEFDGHKITTAWSANQTDCVKIANKQDI